MPVHDTKTSRLYVSDDAGPGRAGFGRRRHREETLRRRAARQDPREHLPDAGPRGDAEGRDRRRHEPHPRAPEPGRGRVRAAPDAGGRPRAASRPAREAHPALPAPDEAAPVPPGAASGRGRTSGSAADRDVRVGGLGRRRRRARGVELRRAPGRARLHATDRRAGQADRHGRRRSQGRDDGGAPAHEADEDQRRVGDARHSRTDRAGAGGTRPAPGGERGALGCAAAETIESLDARGAGARVGGRGECAPGTERRPRRPASRGCSGHRHGTQRQRHLHLACERPRDEPVRHAVGAHARGR